MNIWGKEKTKKKISIRYHWNDAKVGFLGLNSIPNKKFVKRSNIGYNTMNCLTLNVKLDTENHSIFYWMSEELKVHCTKVM